MFQHHMKRSGSPQYKPVESIDLEGAPLSPHHKKKRISAIARRLWPLAIILVIYFLASFIFRKSKDGTIISVWGPEDLNFDSERPTYLDAPLENPVVIRLAIICRVDEFEMRQTYREAMLDGVSKKHVHLEYKFFVGSPVPANPALLAAIAKENAVHDDVMVLENIRDIPERISEKRFAALKWTASVPHYQYDWSLTIDSDTFCRFPVLAQRLQYIYPAVNPREESAMIGRMGEHLVYFENTVSDDEEDDKAEDHLFKARWYPYPVGIGYMLSSNLTATLMSAKPSVPHHINYPSDDVMIGSWVAALKDFHDPSIKFHTTPENDDPPIRPVYPKPYLPYSLKTTIIDDKIGWHDFKNRGRFETTTQWDTACVHRMRAHQMKAFRKMKEVKDEWEAPPRY